MKAAIYSRKSKFTAKGESIENQIEMCKEYCNKNFDEEIEFIIYEDEGFSGGNVDRPQFQQMIKDAKNEKFDALVCYRLDRVSRNVADFSTTLELLQQHNISFISIKEQFDTSTPMGKAMVYIASVFAQLERETIAERVRDNMIELAKTGRWLGGPPPMGFKSEKVIYYDAEMKQKSMHKLSPIKEDLDFVKLIYKKYIELGSTHQVRKYFLQNNITSLKNKDLSSSVIHRVLRNPVYVRADDKVMEYLQSKNITIAGDADGKHGLLVYNKVAKNRKQKDKNEWIAAIAKHNGIIDSDEWLKIQSQLDTNSKITPALGKSNVALLTGLLKCKKCGRRMSIVYGSKKKDGTKHYYYACTLKKFSNVTRCNNKNANGTKLDAFVVSRLKELTADEGLLSKQLHDFKNEVAVTESEDKSKNIKKEISTNEDSINNLVKQLSKNQNSAAADYIMKEIERLDRKNKELKNKLAVLDLQLDNSQEKSLDIDLMLRTARQFNDIIDTSDIKLKKYLISTLVDSIYWDGDKQEADINIFGSKKKLNDSLYEENLSHFCSASSCTKIKNATFGTIVELKDTTFTSSIGSKIKKYRLLKNFTQKELGTLMGIDPCQFYYYEHDIFYPRYPSLIKMANILKIDVKKLMDNYYLFITSPKYKNFFENLRLQNNWTYNDVENILGINPYTYREWELGAKLGRDLYIKLRKKLFELKIINKLNIKK